MAFEYLKNLFVDEEGNPKALTADELEAAITSNKLKVVNLADGGYVAKQKFDDKDAEVKNLTAQITQRDTDLADIQNQLTAAQADAGKLQDVTKQLTDLQANYTADKQKYEDQLKQQKYEFAVKEATSSLQFTSPSAKRAFTEDAIKKGFQMEGDKVLGFDDYVNEYKTNIDPAAFVSEEDPEPNSTNNNQPRFAKGTGGNNGGKKGGKFANMTLQEKMLYRNEHPEVSLDVLFPASE